MTEINPYAAPQSAAWPQTTGASPFAAAATAGLWRKGNLLVMHRNAILPAVCVKSNQPADGRLLRKLNWHHPIIYVVLLFSPLIYIILALIITKRARIEIGLSEPYFARRRRDMAIGWTATLAGIGSIAIGFVSVDQGGDLGPLMLVGAILFIVGALYGLLRARMVSADRIAGDYVWLKGVHPDLLAQLPLWPYQP